MIDSSMKIIFQYNTTSLCRLNFDYLLQTTGDASHQIKASLPVFIDCIILPKLVSGQITRKRRQGVSVVHLIHIWEKSNHFINLFLILGLLEGTGWWSKVLVTGSGGRVPPRLCPHRKEKIGAIFTPRNNYSCNKLSEPTTLGDLWGTTLQLDLIFFMLDYSTRLPLSCVKSCHWVKNLKS